MVAVLISLVYVLQKMSVRVSKQVHDGLYHKIANRSVKDMDMALDNIVPENLEWQHVAEGSE